MKQILLRSIIPLLVVLLATQISQANYARRCGFVFAKKPVDLKTELDLIKKMGPENYRNQTKGQWVEVAGEWFRYKIMGSSGPLRVHFFGLGSELYRSYSENLVLKEYSKTGRVLLIELPGQGLTEVHQVYNLVKNGFMQKQKGFLARKRIIDFEKSSELSLLATHKILESLGENPSNVKIWSGDSFGGANLSGSRNHLKPDALTQFFATPFSTLENYFVQKKSHDTLDRWRRGFDRAFKSTDIPLGTQIGLLIVRKVIGSQRIVKTNDKMALDGATGQYYGFKPVRPGQLAENFPRDARVQVFTAEKDTIVYPMMHYEFISQLQSKGIAATGVLVENINHNMTKNMTSAQREIVAKMTKNPEDFNGFYILKENGTLVQKTAEEILPLYKSISKKIWLAVHQKSLTNAFRPLGHKVSYPASWR